MKKSMGRMFFNFEKEIFIKDILKILNITDFDFYKNNKNFNDSIIRTKIIDFVPFNKMKFNTLSYLSNNNNNNTTINKGICIVKKESIDLLNINIIKIPYENPKLAFSKILNFYFNKYDLHADNHKIHPSAIIDKKSIIGKNVNIGPFSVIEEGVTIEDGVYISERVTISKNCKIGKKTFIGSGVFIECSHILEQVVIHPNTVIGKSGFGFIPNKSDTILTPHIGSVSIGNNTNIGSNCTIDRGLIDNTIIGDFVMIDNQVHIGHNCIINDYCILAGQVGLSGSVTLDENVIIGGDVSIKDNVTIGKNSIVAGASKVFNSFPENSKIGGSPAQNLLDWKKLIISQRQNVKKRKKN
ncbi:MAG: UDP-3-O-(3-hydroxymyristoyl)glucosamine N-acyltransferase [Proteobacteria bacterium]|nr:UDP-3-O-(3-hydroxymyristoyl)glucosamine N-acyltransferase [Pseudomonadota bacterium]